MRDLVTNANNIPSFFPSWQIKMFVDEPFRKHVSDLCIPAVSGGQPSLLLHSLGEERSKLEIFSLLQNICM